MDERAKREGQVTVWLDSLDKAVQELGETINLLQERLTGVLSVLYSKEGGVPPITTDPEEALVEVAHSIRTQQEQLENQRIKLSSIISRIEL